jgi:hypothetical protein
VGARGLQEAATGPNGNKTVGAGYFSERVTMLGDGKDDAREWER